MNPDTMQHNASPVRPDAEICDVLAREIERHGPEAENRIRRKDVLERLKGRCGTPET